MAVTKTRIDRDPQPLGASEVKQGGTPAILGCSLRTVGRAPETFVHHLVVLTSHRFGKGIPRCKVRDWYPYADCRPQGRGPGRHEQGHVAASGTSDQIDTLLV